MSNPDKIARFAEELVNLTVKEVQELSEVLKEQHGIEPMSMAAAPVVASEAEAKEEKTIFDVVLTAVGTSSKLKVIKFVKETLSMGLKEAKDFVEEVAKGAQTIKEKMPKVEAEKLKKELEDLGATVTLQ